MATPARLPLEGRRRSRANGEGGIREDKKRGRWVATVTVGWETTVDADGGISSRQVRRSVTGRTKTQVLARMREVQQLVDDGIAVPSSSLTVAAMLDHWLLDVLPG